MNVFKKAFRATCKAAQATAKYGTRTVMTPVVGAGKLGQVALKGAAKVAEMAGWDRGSEALDDFGAAIDHGATMVSDCATAGVGIATGSVMAIASFATGQDDVADELGDSIRVDIDSFRDNRDSFVVSGK